MTGRQFNNASGEDSVYASQRRNQGNEESYSSLLIKGDGADEGDGGLAMGREKGDPTLDIEPQNPIQAEPSPLST